MTFSGEVVGALVPPQKGGDAGAGLLAQRLRSAIVMGELSPNERLVEMELAQRYEVSRGAVRLALLQLAIEGLVEREANRGARVRSVTIEEVVEIYEVRMVTEGLCAAKAAVFMTDEVGIRLDAVLAGMEDAVSGGDLLGYSSLNHTLHRIVVETSRHATATALVERLRNQSVSQRFRLALVPGRAAASLTEHRRIVAALHAKDPVLAEQAMRSHLVGAVEALRLLPARPY